MLAWGHLGCVELDRFAFWSPRTTTTAYVVGDLWRWVNSGAPLPSSRGTTSAFIAFSGAVRLSRLVKAVEHVSTVVGEGHVVGGVFPTDEAKAYALLALSSAE